MKKLNELARIKLLILIDKVIIYLFAIRSFIHGQECRHEIIREVVFSYAPHMNNRWCKTCKLQETEQQKYHQLNDRSWRKIDTFRP